VPSGRRGTWRLTPPQSAYSSQGHRIHMQHPVCVQVRAQQAKVVAPDIHSQVEGRGPEILRALDIRWPPRRGQTHIHCPLPLHADRNPSWRWDGRKERWFCTCGSGNIVDLVIAMLGSDFVTAAAWIRREALCISSIEPNSGVAQIEFEVDKREARQLERERQEEEHQAQRRRVAQAIYGCGLSAAGSIIEPYLRSRSISIPVPDTIRFLPATPLRYPHPCMLAVYGLARELEPGRLSIPAADIRGIHLTKLNPDGTRKADVPRDEVRRSIGGHGWPIVLAPVNDGGGLAIGEGIETMLSVAEVTGLGAWAAGAASWMPVLANRVPSYVEAVTAYAEADQGRLHAARLAERLDGRGFEVTIAEVGR